LSGSRYEFETLANAKKLRHDTRAAAQVLYRLGVPFVDRSNRFFLAGAWVVLIFTSLELGVVTLVFFIYCRHALDSETIEIEDQRLLVKKFIG
jgi:uncharacterized membrane protein